MQDIERQIKKWLDETNLSEEAKKTLQDEAIIHYNYLVKELSIPPKELANDALHVTCDKYSCAIIRKLPKADMSYLAEVRRKTGILPAEPIEKVDAMVKLLKRGDNLSNRAKEILSAYKDRDSKAYFKGSPSVTAATAIRIASILLFDFNNDVITPQEIRNNFNITPSAINSKYHEMAQTLNLYDVLPERRGEAKRYLAMFGE